MRGWTVALASLIACAPGSRPIRGSPPTVAATATNNLLPPTVPDGGVVAITTLGFEASRYGWFEVAVHEKDCDVSFRHATGERTSLFTVQFCLGAAPGIGITTIGSLDRLGKILLPVVDADGDEFHVFGIAGARGGNAFSSTEYWVSVVRQHDAWSSAPLIGDLKTGDIVSQKIVLEQPATTTDTGARYTVTFGTMTQTNLPILPSNVVSRRTQVLAGKFFLGFHYTNWRPTIRVDSTETIIDEDGACKLSELAQESAVTLTVELAKWSDGRTTVKCLQMRR